jgi:predicted nucleic acid-binding protein
MAIVSIQTWVVDSSVILKWMLTHKEDWLDKADLLLKRFISGKIKLAAPVLAKYEVANAIRFKSYSNQEKLDFIKRFSEIPLKYYQVSAEQIEDIMILANDRGITFYDAVFMELAQRLNATLITANPKHQKSLPGVKVVDLKNYSVLDNSH